MYRRLKERCAQDSFVTQSGRFVLVLDGSPEGRAEYGHLQPSMRRCASGRSHRFTYETFVVTIPEGLDLDHLCRVRDCVPPAGDA